MLAPHLRRVNDGELAQAQGLELAAMARPAAMVRR